MMVENIEEDTFTKVEYFHHSPDSAARIKELEAEVERLKPLSVTNIMVDVVPGHDGSGQEVFAASVADVERVLTRLSEKAESYDLETTPLRKANDALKEKLRVARDALNFIYEESRLVQTGEMDRQSIQLARTKVFEALATIGED
jgi:hypothetical protein